MWDLRRTIRMAHAGSPLLTSLCSLSEQAEGPAPCFCSTVALFHVTLRLNCGGLQKVPPHPPLFAETVGRERREIKLLRRDSDTLGLEAHLL